MLTSPVQSVPKARAWWPTLSVRQYFTLIAVLAVLPWIGLAIYVGDRVANDARDALRTALMSAGELLAPDARTLAFALWPSSRTAQAVTASGRATLAFVFDEAFYQVQLDAQRVPLDDVPLACFIGTIENGEMQRVGYARLTSGIAFELTDAQSALARWREQVEWLKRAASAAA